MQGRSSMSYSGFSSCDSLETGRVALVRGQRECGNEEVNGRVQATVCLDDCRFGERRINGGLGKKVG